MIEVRVPATTANMGTGFDSFGAALGLYNTISVKELDEGLKIKNFGVSDYVATGENNLIYRAMMNVFDYVGYEKKGLSIYQRSNIPQTRGLGSSSACIIGGMVAANALSGRKLDYKKILELAAAMEGHPDNVAPALFGGFCISVKDENGVVCESIKPLKRIRYIAMIPEYYIVTKKSREILPEKVSLEDAAHNISRASAFALSMAKGRYNNLKMFVDDRLHQPYRASYIEGMDDIFEKGYSLGAKAVYLSGSGPTIIAMVEKHDAEFVKNMREFFKSKKMSYRVCNLSIDNVGTVVKYIEEPEYPVVH